MISPATLVRYRLLVFIGAAIVAATIVVAIGLWADSRKVPRITIMPLPTEMIAVDIRGAVSTPGVIYLSPGARMVDVVDAAGGFSVDANTALVNQSARVVDGQMIVIPTIAPAGSVDTSGLVNINTATVDELRKLPGIGEVYATRIVVYRTNHGPYQHVDDLLLVDGITPNLLESLRPLITVDSDD